MKPHHGRDLTQGSIPRLMVAFSVPMLLGTFLQTAYSFINAIWVGQFLGTTALAAVTVSFPIIFLLIAMGMGLTLATNILVSQNFGAKRMDELKRVVDSSNLLVLGLGLTLTIFGELMTPTILRAMDTPPHVMDEAASYLRVFLISLPMSYALFLLRSVLQGIGDSKTPLYFQLGSVLFTTILDPVLMFGWFGFPKLGLNGTAWATVISQFVVVVVLVFYLRRRGGPVAPSWPRLDHLGDATFQTIRIGLPTAVQQSLNSMGMVFVTGIVNGFGETAVAGFGAASRIDQIIFLPAMTLSMAVGTLAGQNIGAGLFDRVKEVFKWGCLMSGGLTLLASAFIISFPQVILHIFVNDPTVIDIGAHYLRIVGSCYSFFAIMFVAIGVINGAGHTITTTLISLISLWVIRVPLGYFLSKHLSNVEGVWYAISLSFFVSMCVAVAYYLSGRWKKPLGRKRGPVSVSPPNPAQVFGSETGEA